jgi:hypothetical protein
VLPCRAADPEAAIQMFVTAATTSVAPTTPAPSKWLVGLTMEKNCDDPYANAPRCGLADGRAAMNSDTARQAQPPTQYRM